VGGRQRALRSRAAIVHFLRMIENWALLRPVLVVLPALPFSCTPSG
jgi:hypothetical protein